MLLSDVLRFTDVDDSLDVEVAIIVVDRVAVAVLLQLPLLLSAAVGSSLDVGNVGESIIELVDVDELILDMRMLLPLK